MIKVLIIISGGLINDGITLSQIDIVKKINKEKFKIDILALHNDSKSIINVIEECGCNVIQMPDRKKKFIEYRKKLKSILKENKYDIIHVHGSSALLFIELSLANKYHIPVRIAHSRNTMCNQKILDRLLRPFFYKSYNVALACGEDAGKWLFKNNFIIMHNGKDLDKFSFNESIRANYRKKLLLKNELAIGHVGAFNQQKNHAFLIKIFKKIHEENKTVKLFLFGTGEKELEIRDLVRKYNLTESVKFCGNVANIWDYLQAMDIMLFPSIFEGLPNVVLEWQCSGLPALISDKITDECIISNSVNKVSIEDIDCWVQSLKKIKVLSNVERKEISEVNKNLLRENGFEIDSNVKEIEKKYEEWLNIYKK